MGRKGEGRGGEKESDEEEEILSGEGAEKHKEGGGIADGNKREQDEQRAGEKDLSRDGGKQDGGKDQLGEGVKKPEALEGAGVEAGHAGGRDDGEGMAESGTMQGGAAKEEQCGEGEQDARGACGHERFSVDGAVTLS